MVIMIIERRLKCPPTPSIPTRAKRKKKSTCGWGFGNYSGGGVQGPINPGNVRADSSIFDRLLELFGLKEKTKNENKEASEEEWDPGW
jgi:hypothetical protein